MLVALLGLVGQHRRPRRAARHRRRRRPESARRHLRGPIEGVVNAKGGAGALFGIGLLGALWSASGYIGAFIRASNAIYEVEEGRPFWKLRPLQVALTVAMVLLLALVAIALVVTGPLAERSATRSASATPR